MGSTHQAVQEECSHSCGQRKEELGLTANVVSSSLHLILPPPHFSPWAPRLCLCLKWQDTIQKWEREWAWLSLQGCDSNTCIWHFAIYRLFILCSAWIPTGWFILTREPMASLMPSIYYAKRERQEERSISFCVSWSIPSSFPPPAPSCIVETETFLWETLCLWHNSMVFNTTSSAIFPLPSLLTIHKLYKIASTIKATGRGKNWV